MGKALLVVDVQKGVFADGGRTAFAGVAMIQSINQLVARARAAGSPVVFVQHDDDYLLRGSDPWELVADLDVRSGDMFIEKQHGSAFHLTPLREQLFDLGIEEIVICGMQTEFCIDSTFRHALTLGLKVELAQDAHTTFDLGDLSAKQIIDHHNVILSGYGRVVQAEAVTFAPGA